MDRGKYGLSRRGNELLTWLLDTAFVAAGGLVTSLMVLVVAAVTVAAAIGTQLRQRIAAHDLVMDPADTITDTDPTDPVHADAVRLDREEHAA